jgi:simple sugar transport system ATP-binding protein
MVELKGIQKYFPANGVNALDQADFTLRPGEIHALLGENGAGKSTLMHIMAGYLKPGAGHILIDGREYHFSAPVDAMSAGIGMVRQHPHLVPGFTVWEDCVLGAEPLSAGLFNRGKARALVQALSERWGFDLPLDKPTESLTVSQRQKAAILALLLRGALPRHKNRDIRYLIFDEVTAVLSPGETENLFALFRRLRAEGKGIVIISHKLEETLDLTDQVSVLRRGRTVAVLSSASLDSQRVSALMFDADSSADPAAVLVAVPTVAPDLPPRVLPKAAPEEGLPVSPRTGGISVQGLSIEVRGRPFIRRVDLELLPGKILGIAGVRDSGLETLELGITGFLPPSAGKIILRGRDITGKGPRAFRDAQGAYIGTDRTGGALSPALRLQDNIILHAHRRSRRGVLGALGIMDRRLLNSWIRDIMETARVTGNPRTSANAFSGGMLQRILLAREFAENASVLVLAEPSWGLDRAGRDRLFQGIQTQVKAGTGILVFSTDVDELLSLSDEILVLRNGEFSDRISLEYLRNTPDPNPSRGELKERISRAMIGGAANYPPRLAAELSHG